MTILSSVTSTRASSLGASTATGGALGSMTLALLDSNTRGPQAASNGMATRTSEAVRRDVRMTGGCFMDATSKTLAGQSDGSGERRPGWGTPRGFGTAVTAV